MSVCIFVWFLSIYTYLKEVWSELKFGVLKV